MPMFSQPLRRLLGGALVVLAAASLMAVVLLPLRAEGDAAGSVSTMQSSPSGASAGVGPEVRLGGETDDGGDTAHVGFGYGDGVASPTKDKPQSKLWYQDGSWWAAMVNPSTAQVHVFELEDNHAWRDTGVVIDDREASTADVLWDGERLHVASRTGAGEIRYVRLTYLPEARSYAVDAGMPVVVATGGSKSVSLGLDSGALPWVTFLQDGVVMVAHGTSPQAEGWTPPFVLPAGDAAVATDDDVSSVDSLDGQMAVMWSNQRTGAFYFTVHDDGASDSQWSPPEVPVEGEGMADGHVNLLVVDGVAYAAVKTALDDLAGAPGSAPLILVLQRAPDGTWVRHVAGTVADDLTRPEITVSAAERVMYLSYATPSAGGRIHLKIGALDGMRWAPGPGTPIIAVPGGVLNDVTGTKQAVDRESGLVLLASDAVARRYYHVERPVGAGQDSATAVPTSP